MENEKDTGEVSGITRNLAPSSAGTRCHWKSAANWALLIVILVCAWG